MKSFQTCAVIIITGVSCHFLLAVVASYQSKETECIDSGLVLGDGTKIYSPQNCRPTECAATGRHGAVTNGFQCSVGNYLNSNHNSCENIKNALLSQPHWSDRLEDVCQAKLVRIDLYQLHCKELNITEVSLNFTFQLPICGKKLASPLDAVMVDFNAKNDSIYNYFAIHPVCRTFDYGGSDFHQLMDNDSIQVSYDCMGIGLQYKDPKVYYYLSLTAFPSGALLNYTLVYMHAGPESMQLVAAAWQSTSQVHVVFQPISGVTRYRVLASSSHGDWSFFKEVSSDPSVEITGIPPESIIISVMVTPIGCVPRGERCGPIAVTLHDKTSIGLRVELKEKPADSEIVWSAWPRVLVVVVGIVLVSALIALTVRMVLVHRKKQPGGDIQVLCIADRSKENKNMQKSLEKCGFLLKDALQEKITQADMMNDCSFIVVFMHPSLPQSPHWGDLLQLIKLIFENPPLWSKTRVAAFKEKGDRHFKPSEILCSSYNQQHWEGFLKYIDKKTFNLNQDMNKLIEDLKQDGGKKLQCARFYQASAHEEESTVRLVSETADTGDISCTELPNTQRDMYIDHLQSDVEADVDGLVSNPWQRDESCTQVPVGPCPVAGLTVLTEVHHQPQERVEQSATCGPQAQSVRQDLNFRHPSAQSEASDPTHTYHWGQALPGVRCRSTGSLNSNGDGRSGDMSIDQPLEGSEETSRKQTLERRVESPESDADMVRKGVWDGAGEAVSPNSREGVSTRSSDMNTYSLISDPRPAVADPRLHPIHNTGPPPGPRSPAVDPGPPVINAWSVPLVTSGPPVGCPSPLAMVSSGSSSVVRSGPPVWLPNRRRPEAVEHAWPEHDTSDPGYHSIANN